MMLLLVPKLKLAAHSQKASLGMKPNVLVAIAVDSESGVLILD